MRNTTAKMGGLSEERSKKGRGCCRKVERNGQRQGAIEKIMKVAVQQKEKRKKEQDITILIQYIFIDLY